MLSKTLFELNCSTEIFFRKVIGTKCTQNGNCFTHVSYFCYEPIMFGWITHTLEAAAMRVRSFVYVIHIL